MQHRGYNIIVNYNVKVVSKGQTAHAFYKNAELASYCQPDNYELTTHKENSTIIFIGDREDCRLVESNLLEVKLLMCVYIQ